MTKLLTIFALLLSAAAHGQMLTNKLIGYYLAGDWDISPNGGVGNFPCVTNWHDRSSVITGVLVTNNFVNTNLITAPVPTNDFDGTVCLSYPNNGSDGFQVTFLTNTGMAADQRTNTVFIVASGATGYPKDTIFSPITGHTLALAAGQPTLWTNPPQIITPAAFVSFNFFPHLNKSVLGSTQSSTNKIQLYNWNVAATIPFGAAGALSNARIGGDGYSGRVYALFVYASAFSTNQMLQMAQYCMTNFNINATNYTSRVISVGDSWAYGGTSTNFLDYFKLMYLRYPEFEYYNEGAAGARIGTNGNNVISSVYIWASYPSMVANYLYDSTKSNNWVFCNMGGNDIGVDGITGAAAFGRLTNFMEVQASTNNFKWIMLTQGLQSSRPEETNFNTLIRKFPSFWYGVADAGWGSPYETAFNLPDPTAYSTGHPTSLGAAVLNRQCQMFINICHRQPGFMGQ